LDRIYINIEFPRIDYEKLSGNRAGAAEYRPREIQRQAFASLQSDIICNADVRVREIRQFRLGTLIMFFDQF
jgi:hypothetical protein